MGELTLKEAHVKLYPRKAGNGFVGNYLVSIGSSEARRVGFVTREGERRELEKEIDETAQTVTFRLAKSKKAGEAAYETA